MGPSQINRSFLVVLMLVDFWRWASMAAAHPYMIVKDAQGTCVLFLWTSMEIVEPVVSGCIFEYAGSGCDFCPSFDWSQICTLHARDAVYQYIACQQHGRYFRCCFASSVHLVLFYTRGGYMELRLGLGRASAYKRIASRLVWYLYVCCKV